MTTQTEALKLALEALEDRASLMKWQMARDAVKEVLAQPDPYKQGYADAMNWKVQNHLEHLPAAQPEQEPVAKAWQELTLACQRVASPDQSIELRDALDRFADAVSEYDARPLTLDYIQGHKDGCEWSARLATANDPRTSDWLYDDPHELAKALRKGPEFPPAPTAQPEQEPVADSYSLADKVREALDRQSCPDAFMQIAWETVVKHYTTPPQRKEPEQEPAKYKFSIGCRACGHLESYDMEVNGLTTPPQRTWVGLTNEEANELWESTDSDWELMKRTEAKLKEKNNA